MKLLTTITLGLLTTISLNAKTTMCFKENHLSMTTIETIALDGGECSSSKNVQDMKKDGWSVDDIKIEKATNGNNYIYVFKKDEINTTSINEEKLEQKILQRLETRKKEEQLTRKREIKVRMSKDGKKLYINKCQNCHGEKANELVGNSRDLTKLNFFDFKTTIRDYGLGEYDRGTAFSMLPYANLMDSRDIKNVYSYIYSLKPKKNQQDLEKELEEESK